MKKQLAISALAAGSLLWGGVASAADLPEYTKAPAAPAAYDWSGVYIGGHVGGGWSTTSFADPTAVDTLGFVTNDFVGSVAGTKANASSFLGGAQIGWMYQIARLVIGGDLDFSGTSLTGTGSGIIQGFSNTIGGSASGTETYSVHTDWTATATTTLGLARGEWLFYSKAGAAFAHNSYNISVAANDTLRTPAVSLGFSAPGTTETRIGWTVGAGMKWAFANNWFANIEYDYLDFGSKAQGFTGQLTGNRLVPPNTNATLTPIFNERISQVKVGVNYKFPAGFLLW
jgi:outer membrane immunogenic protein